MRDDIAVPSPPMSVALGDLDGVHGKDIAIALWQPGKVGVMLNHGDGTFGALQQYSAGPKCVGQAVEIELGDVTGPAGAFVPDGKLDVYVACTPYVVRLTGDGTGALGSPSAFQLYLPPYHGSATIDFLALVRRPDGNPAPLLALQHSVGSFGRQLCISYELDSEALVCSPTPVQGPLAVGDINGAFPGVPPDEIVTGRGRRHGGHLRFRASAADVLLKQRAHGAGASSRPPSATSTATVASDVLVGQSVNSASERADSIHYFLMGAGELEQVARTLPSTPGLDAVAIADVDADGCSDVVGAGGHGRGMIHLGDGAGGFDGGQDLPQLGYQNPADRDTGDHGGERPDRRRPAGAGDRRPARQRRHGLPQRLHAGRRAVLRHAAATDAGASPGGDEPAGRRRADPGADPDPDARWLRAPVRNREARVTSSGRPVTMCSSAASAATC